MKLPSIKTVKGLLGRKSPTILTVLSIGGLIGTVVMAVRATPKVLDLIADEKHFREESEEDEWRVPMTRVDIVKLTWMCYMPAVAMGCATIASIIGSNTINLKRNAALTGAYYLSETALKEYQAKIIETIGAKKAKLIKDEIAQDRVNKTKKESNTIIITGNGDTLCLDIVSGRYFKSSVDKINKAENAINKCMRDQMWMSLNEIYGFMDLDPISIGGECGWDINTDGEFGFDISTTMSDDDTPCITVNFITSSRPRS